MCVSEQTYFVDDVLLFWIFDWNVRRYVCCVVNGTYFFVFMLGFLMRRRLLVWNNASGDKKVDLIVGMLLLSVYMESKEVVALLFHVDIFEGIQVEGQLLFDLDRHSYYVLKKCIVTVKNIQTYLKI